MVFLIAFGVGSKKNLGKWVGVGAFGWNRLFSGELYVSYQRQNRTVSKGIMLADIPKTRIL